MDIDIRGHFTDMLKERQIQMEWINRTIADSDKTEDHDDGTKHYIKMIPEFGNRWLRVVINNTVMPQKGVTAFFDRRIRKEYENQSR